MPMRALHSTKAGSAPDTAGKVVTKPCVGFGDPLTVTVAAALSGVGVEPDVDVAVLEELSTLNRGEVVYITPCVEFRNSRK